MLELGLDRRLGGFRRYYVREQGERLLLVPEEVRKCVAFVYCKSATGLHPLGTAFFLASAIEDTDRAWPVTVTAKHLLRHIGEHSVDQTVHIRLNLKGAGLVWMQAPLTHWRFHPSDPTADVAVLPMFPGEECDFRTFGLESSATPEVMQAEGVGVGDEVFIVGLFVNHLGKSKNIPIVRIGNIAAMPDERVATKEFGAMDAHLIEARSIGGLSGSPVFVHVQAIRVHDESLNITADDTGQFWLFGLMHGHFDAKSASATQLNDERINMGIGIVVPVPKIIETINQQELLDMKNKQRQKIKEEMPQD